MTQMVFIGGMGRSGTDLLRRMLNAHSEIAAGPEFNHIEDIIKVFRALYRAIEGGRIAAYLNHDELCQFYGNFIMSLFQPYAERHGASIVVEKTPSNIWFFPELSFVMPNAKFIHIIRDGRDVACSHREVGERMAKAGGRLEFDRDSAVVSIFHCAALWSETIRYGLSLSDPRSLLAQERRIVTVRYEDLVTHPAREARRLCDFLEIRYEEGMAAPEKTAHDAFADGFWVTPQDSTRAISRGSVGRWRTELTLRERVLFSAKGLEGLIRAGYERNGEWAADGLAVDPVTIPREVRSAECEVEMHVARNSSHESPRVGYPVRLEQPVHDSSPDGGGVFLAKLGVSRLLVDG